MRRAAAAMLFQYTLEYVLLMLRERVCYAVTRFDACCRCADMLSMFTITLCRHNG